MTTTENTVVNFSVRDVLFRIKRVDLQDEIKNKLSAVNYSFQKRHKGFSKDYLGGNPAPVNLPSDTEIINTIKNAKIEAIQCAMNLGLLFNKEADNFTIPFQINRVALHEIKSTQNDSDLEDDVVLTYHSEIDEEIREDLEKIPGIENLNIKNYEWTDLNDPDITSHFCKIKVTDNGIVKTKVIRKSTLCWLFSNKNNKISSDRRLRFTTRNLRLKRLQQRSNYGEKQ